MTPLPTPGEIALRFQPVPAGDRPDHGAGQRAFAEDVAAATYAAVREALEADLEIADETGFTLLSRTLRSLLSRLPGGAS